MSSAKVECFAYGLSKCGREFCSALTELNCQGCNFFKTFEQQEQDLKRAEELREKHKVMF